MKIDMEFSEDAREAVSGAVQALKDLRHRSVDTEHLLLGLIRSRPEVLRGCCEPSELEDAVRRLAPKGDADTSEWGEFPYAESGVRVLQLTVDVATEAGAREVVPGHLLVGLIREGEGVAAEALREMGIEAGEDWIS